MVYESVKECILKVFKLSVSTGCFPTQLKHASITPILKGKDLESDELKNFGSVSNLPFLSS